jgi:hypothetical protein
MTWRRDERQRARVADLGIQMPPDFHIEVVAEQPLDVHALITPPTHEVSSGCCL